MCQFAGLYGSACKVNRDCRLGFYVFIVENIFVYCVIAGLYGSACKVNSDCQLGFMCLLSKISLFIVSLQVYMALHVK